MSIALIQLTDKHTEVVGGLISLFEKSFKNFYIYYESYPSDFCTYYKTALQSPNIRINLIKDPKVVDVHDLYVFVTGVEYVLFKNDKILRNINTSKVILVSHNTEEYDYLKNEDVSVIAITPVYKKLSHFLTYCKLPLKNLHTNSSSKIKIFLSGFTNPQNKDLKGLKRLFRYLIKKSIDVFEFNITNYYSIDELDEFSDICKVHVDANAQKMMKILSESDYVMTLTKENSSYHTRQLTGIIPLAVSLGIPIIMDKDLAKIYGFSSKNSIIYSFNGINTVKDIVLSLIYIYENYNNIRKELIKLRNSTILKERNKMIEFLNNEIF